jgi:hypothetical protein
METKDIIGKEIECFKFYTSNMLTYNHDKYLGKKGIVLNINRSYPQFAEVKVDTENGKTINVHYPTNDILKQLNEEEELTIDDILNNIKNLTKDL